MNNFNFGNLDDILEASGDRNWLARAAWLALKITLLVLSAATTAAFFMAYAGGIFASLVGADLSPYLAAVAGVMVLDGAAIIWSYLRANHADTLAQMTIAGTAGIADLVGSLATTALYLALASGFEVGVYTAGGELTTLGQVLHYTGLVLVIAGISGNFAAMYLYSGAAAQVRSAEQARQLSAEAGAGRFAADRARARLVTERTLAGILSQLPGLAERQGEQSAGDYLNQTMSVKPASPPRHPREGGGRGPAVSENALSRNGQEPAGNP